MEPTKAQQTRSEVSNATDHADKGGSLDDILFASSPESFDQFLTRLDEPPRKNRELQKLINTPAPWEK